MRHGEAVAGGVRAEQGARSEEPRRISRSAARCSLARRSTTSKAAARPRDAEDARRVADKLGIPFYALNLQAEFGQIIDYFVAEYTAGRTPNPCVQCNNWIKFGKLFDYADSVGAEFVATGHYARLEAACRRQRRAAARRRRGEGPVVRAVRHRPRAAAADDAAGRAVTRSRRSAGSRPSLGLRVAEKKDSQEICFVTRGRYDEFVRRRARRRHGRRARDDRRHGRRRARRHRRLHRRPAQGARRRAGRAEVRRADRAGIAPRGDRRSRGARSPRADGARLQLARRRSRRRNRRPHRCYAQIRYNAAAQPADDDACLPERRLHVGSTSRSSPSRRGRRSFVTTRTTTSACSAAAGSSRVKM